MNGPIIACEARTGCRSPARIQVEVCGVKAHLFEPTNTCRGHVSIVIMSALSISNDVRVRSAV